jgi:hypothetical protein
MKLRWPAVLAAAVLAVAAVPALHADAATRAQCPRTAGVIYGTVEDDLIKGTPGDDVICGGSGNDKIYGMGGTDTIYGGPGNDKIYGGSGRETIFGGSGSATRDLISSTRRRSASTRSATSRTAGTARI